MDGSFNTEVLNDFSDYLSDHFALRQELITAQAALDAGVFRVSAQDDVLLGRDGWLFYRETLDDYLRTAPMTQRQLWASARCLSLIQEYAAGRGARLYFTVVPNKASLYPEFLPDVGAPLEGSAGIDRLVPLLEQEGVAYIDLFSPLRGQDEVLYYRTDSHWDARGAALAHDTVISAMGKSDQQPFFPGSTHTGGEHLGDLYEMLYPTGTVTEPETVYDRAFTFSYVRQPRSPEDQRIETENPARSGNLLMFRDSFGNSLHSFLADAFGSALFSRSMPYQLSLLDQAGADTVLIEIVERNLEWLCQRAPILPAPERLLTGTPPQGEAALTLGQAGGDPGALEGYVRLEGSLSGEMDSDSPIYIQLGEQLYEASPAGEDWEGGAPFTLYVPEGSLTGQAQALYLHDGALYASAAAAILR